MKHLFFETGLHIINGTVIELEPVSTNNYVLYTVTSDSANIKSVSATLPVLIDPAGLVDKQFDETAVKSEIMVPDNSSAFSVMLSSEKEEEVELRIDVEFIDGDSLSFILNQQFEDMSERLSILLNNYGISINEDWYNAFRDTLVDSDSKDNIIINQKSNEFLMSLFDLIGLRGSYKTLLSAISYFGYKELVRLEEHWISNADGVTRRLTPMTLGETKKIFTEDGYRKVGDITLVYALDELSKEEPYDEGGLPNWVVSSMNIDHLFLKMSHLRKVLNDWFIPWDAFIVDIVGEFRKIEGRAIKTWVNNDKFISQDEEQRWKNIKVTFNNRGSLDIEERTFTVSIDEIYTNSTKRLQLRDASVAHIDGKRVVKINLLDDELKKYEFKDFELLKTIQRCDIAVLDLDIECEVNELEFIKSYYIEVYKKKSEDGGEYEVYYKSPKSTNLNDLVASKNRYGIFDIGSYIFKLVFIDQWGYKKSYCNEFSINRTNIKFDFNCYRPKYAGIHLESAELEKRWTMFSNAVDTISGSGIPVVDASHILSVHGSLNEYPFKNTFIRRRYSTTIDDVYLKDAEIKRFVKHPIANLKYLPISEYWAPYPLLAFDILKKGFSISMKLFQHHESETIEYENDVQFLHELIERSKNPDSVYSLFDFDIQGVIPRESESSTARKRLEIDENQVAKNVLLIYSRHKSISIDDVIFRIETATGEVVTNDAYEQGSLYRYDAVLSFFGVNLTLYATNDDSRKMLLDRTNLPFDLYNNTIYPTFGSDPMIRLHKHYNTGENIFNTFTLFGRSLNLYGKDLAFFDSTDWNITNVLRRALGMVVNGKDELNLDFRLRLRIDDKIWVSEKEFGRPIYGLTPDGGEDMQWETEPLSLDMLNSALNKKSADFDPTILGFPDEVYDKLDIYYNDSIFTIVLKEGSELEISQINIGHRMSVDRHGSIDCMFKTKSGIEHQIGSMFIAAPNTDERIVNSDISWTVYEHFSKKKIFESSGYYLAYQCFTPGIYDVSMSIIDKLTNARLTKEKVGCINVL